MVDRRTVTIGVQAWMVNFLVRSLNAMVAQLRKSKHAGSAKPDWF